MLRKQSEMNLVTINSCEELSELTSKKGNADDRGSSKKRKFALKDHNIGSKINTSKKMKLKFQNFERMVRHKRPHSKLRTLNGKHTSTVNTMLRS